MGAVHVDNEEFDAALPSSSPGIQLAWRSGGQPIALNASATIVVLIYILRIIVIIAGDLNIVRIGGVCRDPECAPQPASMKDDHRLSWGVHRRSLAA